MAIILFQSTDPLHLTVLVQQLNDITYVLRGGGTLNPRMQVSGLIALFYNPVNLFSRLSQYSAL
jgi:hypothetical protein